MNVQSKVFELLRRLQISELTAPEMEQLVKLHPETHKSLFKVYICNAFDGYRVQLVPRSFTDQLSDDAKEYIRKELDTNIYEK